MEKVHYTSNWLNGVFMSGGGGSGEREIDCHR
jgi:hypothetical protein